MVSLTQHMRKELIFYIKQEYDKGIPLTRIRKSLLSGGHHQDLVKEALRSLKKHDYNIVKALNEPVKNDLDKELYFNILNSVMRYVEHQLASGTSEKEVKKILEKYGHSKDTIDKAISTVKNERPTVEKRIRNVEIGYGIALAVLIFITAGAAREPLERVFMSFLPSIATIASINISLLYGKGKNMLWLHAPIYSFIMLIMGVGGIIPEGVEYFNLVMMNLLIGFGYTYIRAMREYHIDSIKEALQETVSTENDIEADKKKKNKKK